MTLRQVPMLLVIVFGWLALAIDDDAALRNQMALAALVALTVALIVLGLSERKSARHTASKRRESGS